MGFSPPSSPWAPLFSSLWSCAREVDYKSPPGSRRGCPAPRSRTCTEPSTAPPKSGATPVHGRWPQPLGDHRCRLPIDSYDLAVPPQPIFLISILPPGHSAFPQDFPSVSKPPLAVTFPPKPTLPHETPRTPCPPQPPVRAPGPAVDAAGPGGRDPSRDPAQYSPSRTPGPGERGGEVGFSGAGMFDPGFF